MPSPLKSTVHPAPEPVRAAIAELVEVLSPSLAPAAGERLARAKAGLASVARTLRAGLDQLRTIRAELDASGAAVEISRPEGRAHVRPGDALVVDGDCYLSTNPEQLLENAIAWHSDEGEAPLAQLVDAIEDLATRDEQATCAELARAGLLERWERIAAPVARA